MGVLSAGGYDSPLFAVCISLHHTSKQNWITALQLAGAVVMRQQIDLMLHKIACNILIQIY